MRILATLEIPGPVTWRREPPRAGEDGATIVTPTLEAPTGLGDLYIDAVRIGQATFPQPSAIDVQASYRDGEHVHSDVICTRLNAVLDLPAPPDIERAIRDLQPDDQASVDAFRHAGEIVTDALSVNVPTRIIDGREMAEVRQVIATLAATLPIALGHGHALMLLALDRRLKDRP